MFIGHKKQWDFLKNKFEKDQLSHAYLFSGQDQLGKKTVAKEFVKTINCQDVKKPCNKCANCLRIEKEIFPDFLIIKSENDKENPNSLEIKIAQVKEVQNFLSYKSYYGSYRAVIVDNAERMNNEAQSCFLKTLEEPKGKTLLILITSKPEMLLQTISSRCQTIKFFPEGLKQIEEYLKKQGAEQKEAKMFAELSQGRPGRAVEFMQNKDKLENEKKDLQELVKIMGQDLAQKFQYVKTTDPDSKKLEDILQQLLRYFRNLLLIKSGAEGLEYFSSQDKNFSEYSVLKIKEIINLIENLSRQNSQTNANPKLALEILLMQI